MYGFSSNNFSANLIYNKKHSNADCRNILDVPIVLGELAELAVDPIGAFDLLEHDMTRTDFQGYSPI